MIIGYSDTSRQHQHRFLSAHFVDLSWGKEQLSNASDASDVDVPG
jgi:hypothetical protein